MLPPEDPTPLRERPQLRWPSRGPARVLPTWRAVAGLALVGLLAVVVAGWLLLRARPEQVPLPLPAVPSLAPSPSASPSDAVQLVVDVVGSVRRPGIVRLPAGSRVVDAVAAAGGLRPGAPPGSVNLAAPLTDGQQVVVGAPAPGAPAGAASPGAQALLDLNTATREQLEELPGVGPVLAQRILDWRTAHGRFSRVADLTEVSGIGEGRLADIRDLVRV